MQCTCPVWLGAQVLSHAARGGHGLLLETDDFSVTVLGKGSPNRPGLFVEVRFHFLHAYPERSQGACEEVLCWLHNQLFYDQDERTPSIRERLIHCRFYSARRALCAAQLPIQMPVRRDSLSLSADCRPSNTTKIGNQSLFLKCCFHRSNDLLIKTVNDAFWIGRVQT